MEEINNAMIDNSLIAAFLGGFLSYLFTRIKDYSDNFVKSKQSNINGIVIAERNLVANLMIVYRNKPLLEFYIKSISSNELIIPFFHPYIIRREITDNIKNISIVNMHANCINAIDHMNSTFKQISDQYTESKNAILKGSENSKNSLDTFKRLLEISIEKTLPSFKQLLEIHNNLEKDLLKNIAANQIAYGLATKNMRTWILSSESQFKLPSNMNELVEKRVIEIVNEIRNPNVRDWT